MLKLQLGAVLLAAAGLSFAQTADSVGRKCQLDGQIASLATGAPLRKARVVLNRFEQPGGVSNPPSVSSYATTTGPDGRFTFNDLDSGVFKLSVSRAGYLARGNDAPTASMVDPPITLGAGEHRKDVVIKLVPHALIHGRVLDEDGDPVASAQVFVYRSVLVKGKRRFQQFSDTTVQGDASFVIGNLPPGRYYLRANGVRVEDTAMMQGREGQREQSVPTYYPNFTDAQQAAPITVAAGAEVRGIEIRLRMSHVFRVAGKVVNTLTGGPAPNVVLILAPKGIGDEPPVPGAGSSQSVSSGPDGGFKFENVLPGSYTIRSGGGNFSIGPNEPIERMTIISNRIEMVRKRIENGYRDFINFQPVAPGAGELVGRAAVEVADNIDNLTLSLSSGAVITGSLRTEQTDSNPVPAATNSPESAGGANIPNITLTSTEADSPEVAVAVKDDGTFEIGGVLPGVYAIAVANLPEGAYVKSIRSGGKDVTHATLDFTSGGGLVEVVLSPKGAAITGVVRNADGDPAPGAQVQIWARGDDAANLAEADAKGAFRFAGLAPGDYRVIAWESIDAELLNDPSFRARFEAQAATVTLDEGARQSAEVKLVGRNAIESEASKVR